jgi:hypothetical protein
MARRIELAPDALVVRYEGLDRLMVLVGEVRVPYESIRLVRIGLDELPPWHAFRLGLSTAPLGDHRRGRFWVRGRSWFLDVADPQRAVVLELENGPYDVVAIEPDTDPEQLAAAIRERSPAAPVAPLD